jgi:hypothetical protein
MYQLANETIKIAANSLNTTLEIANKINETCGNLTQVEDQPCEGDDIIAMVSKCPDPQEYRKEAVITFCNNISTVVNFTEQCIEQAFYDYEKDQDQSCFAHWWSVVTGCVAVLAMAGVAGVCYYGKNNKHNKHTFHAPVNSEPEFVNQEEALNETNSHIPGYGSNS